MVNEKNSPEDIRLSAEQKLAESLVEFLVLGRESATFGILCKCFQHFVAKNT